MKQLVGAIALAGAMGAAAPCQARLIDFNAGFDPFFTYQNMSVYNGRPAPNGYGFMQQVAGGRSVFNSFGANIAWFQRGGPQTFTLNSLLVGGAWGTQTLHFEGYVDNDLRYDTWVPITPTPTAVTLDWTNLSQFRIWVGSDYVNTIGGGNGRQWVIDNMIVNQAVPVPEPQAWLLLLAGLASLWIGRKRGFSLSLN